MKILRHNLAIWAAVSLVVLTGAVTAQAQQAKLHAPYFTADRIHQFETNLILGLETGYPGIQSSAAQTLRELRLYNPEYDFSRSIIPLMKIVKSETANTTARLCAILALYDLRSERGDYAIMMTAKFTDNERVKNLCTWLSYVREKVNSDVTENGSDTGREIVQK